MSLERQKDDDEFIGFDIVDFLGEGSYGKVYRAIDAETGLEVGLKVLNMKALDNNNCLYTLSREITALKTAQKKNLTNIIRLYSYKQTTTYTTLVLEYASLGDLSGLIKCYRALPEDWTRFIVAEIILGLEGLHSIGYCHRDIKPSNILITRDGHVRIADFGTSKGLIKGELAMATGAEPFPTSRTQPNSATLVGSQQQEAANIDQQPRGSIYGTICYNAPESNQVGLVYMTPLDVWGLGCILYECLTGVAAFMGDVEMAVVQAIETRKIVVPRTVSPDAADLIRRLLTKDPMKRFQGGWHAVKQHPFFTSHNISFSNLNNQVPPFNPSIVFADLQQFKHMKVPEIVNPEHANMLSLTATDEYRSKDSPLRRFLIPGENIVYSVDVIKRRVLRLQKQRRFVLTDFPRLFYIDATTMVQKGEIDMTSTNLKITRIGERIVEFTLGQNCFTAEVVTKELCDLWLKYLTMYSINGNTSLAGIITNRSNIMSLTDQDMRCGTCKGRLFKNGFCNSCGNVAQILPSGSNTVQYILKMDPRWLPVSEKEMYLRSRLALTSDIQPEMDNLESVSRYETRSSVQKAIDRLRRTQDEVIVYRNKAEHNLEQHVAVNEPPMPRQNDPSCSSSAPGQMTPVASAAMLVSPELKEANSMPVQTNMIGQMNARTLMINPPPITRSRPVSERVPLIYGNQIISLPNIRRSSADIYPVQLKGDEEQPSEQCNDSTLITASSALSQAPSRQSLSIHVIQKQEKDLFEFFHANNSISNTEEAAPSILHGENMDPSVEIKNRIDGELSARRSSSHMDLLAQPTINTPLSCIGRTSMSLITPAVISNPQRHETPVLVKSSPSKPDLLPIKSINKPQEPMTDVSGLLTYMDETPIHNTAFSMASSARASITLGKKETLNPLQSMILGELPELPTNVANQSSHIRITTASSQTVLGSHSHSVRRLLAKIYAVSTAAESLPYPTLPLPRILGYCGDRLLLHYGENTAVIGKLLTTLYVTNNKQCIIPSLNNAMTDHVNPLCLCICKNERRTILNNNISTNYDLTIRHTSSCYTCGGDVFKNIANDEIINDSLMDSPKWKSPSFTHIPSIVFPNGVSDDQDKYGEKKLDALDEDFRKHNDQFADNMPNLAFIDDEIPLVSVDPNENDSTNSYTALSDKHCTSNTAHGSEFSLGADDNCDIHKALDIPSAKPCMEGPPLSNGLSLKFYNDSNKGPISAADILSLQFGVGRQYYQDLRDKMQESLILPSISSQRRCELTFPHILNHLDFKLSDKWYRYFAMSGLSFGLDDNTYKISKVQDLRFLLEMNSYHKQVSLDVTIQYDDSSEGYFDLDCVCLDEPLRSSIVSAPTTYTAEDPITSTATSTYNYQQLRALGKQGNAFYITSPYRLPNRQPYIHYCGRCICSDCIAKVESSDCFIKLETTEKKSAFFASEFGRDGYSFELLRSWVTRRFAFQFLEGNFPLRHKCRYDRCQDYAENNWPCSDVNLRLPFFVMAGPPESSMKKIAVEIPTAEELDEYWRT